MLHRFPRRARRGRKKEANKGRSRLPRRLRGTFEGHRSFIGRNVLVPPSVFLFHATSAPTSSSSSAHGMADQNVAVKKADPLPGSLVRPSPHLLRSRSPHVERRTNDQRNVNRKPREATLINPTEINCGAQRRSSVSLSFPLPFSFACSLSLFLFCSRGQILHSPRWSLKKYLEANLKIPNRLITQDRKLRQIVR